MATRFPSIIDSVSGIRTSSGNIVLPSHSSGDLLLVFASAEQQGIGWTVTNWTALSVVDYSLANPKEVAGVFYKIADGNDDFLTTKKPMSYIGYSLSGYNTLYIGTASQAANTGNIRVTPTVNPGLGNKHFKMFTSCHSRLQNFAATNTLGNNISASAGYSNTQTDTASADVSSSTLNPPSWFINDEAATVTSTVGVLWDEVLTKITFGVPNGLKVIVNGDITKDNLIIKD